MRDKSKHGEITRQHIRGKQASNVVPFRKESTLRDVRVYEQPEEYRSGWVDGFYDCEDRGSKFRSAYKCLSSTRICLYEQGYRDGKSFRLSPSQRPPESGHQHKPMPDRKGRARWENGRPASPKFASNT
jgi:hypothetical protein